ncbi:integrase catalytic domain-containing protein [Nephila pilipes]|uniref:Integrase catalytic domain-containing protein n=1 Tax=Nephila pilipes TaxID=299642 RepID=A0A8X6NU60_NEPPI|nr:integrase catalytic domain-containing protein [Nephila pilipes]GFT31216.1 integrase catalytic domain-containing protein [Nephila pilipes]
MCQRFTVSRIKVHPGMLHQDRVKEVVIFDVLGLGLAGPLNLADGPKFWIVLYSCAVYSVFHLDLVTSLSVETLIQSFRRFIIRTGKTYMNCFDNGTNFVGNNRALQKVY